MKRQQGQKYFVVVMVIRHHLNLFRGCTTLTIGHRDSDESEQRN